MKKSQKHASYAKIVEFTETEKFHFFSQNRLLRGKKSYPAFTLKGCCAGYAKVFMCNGRFLLKTSFAKFYVLQLLVRHSVVPVLEQGYVQYDQRIDQYLKKICRSCEQILHIFFMSRKQAERNFFVTHDTKYLLRSIGA